MNIGKLNVRKEKDIVLVRHAVKTLANIMRFEYLDGIRVATAASELTRNMLEHATGGTINFELVEKDICGLKLVFEDHGKGIKDILEVLKETYKSKVGLGIGLKGAQKLMDEFDIKSAIDAGTTVTITKWLPKDIKFSKFNLDQIKTAFVEIADESAIDTLKTQNRELVEVLEQLRKKNVQLEDVNKELEMTNAGILSLYQEIDKKNEDLDLKSKRKTEFMRSLGHEIRTPLNSIISLSRLLVRQVDGPLHPEQVKQTTMVQESAQFLLTMVNDLLDLSKIEEGILKYSVLKFNIDDLFHHVSATMSSLAAEQGLKLIFQKESDLPEIESDFRLFQQILLNLVGNAVKFTEHGEILVRASKELVVNEEYLRIDVKDSGIGIPENKFDDIFEQFKRLHSNDTLKKGSGLGLPIVKNLTENLGGTINVKSKVGVGSIFTITFPFTFPKKLKIADEEVSEGQLNSDTVLIVEDDENAIYLLRRVFELEGLRVLTARTLERAVKIAEENTLLTICLDILLPNEEDGWMILKALSRNPKTQHIPVIVISVLTHIRDKAIALGADEYMTKPVNKEELLVRLQSYQKGDKIENILVVDDDVPVLMEFRSLLGDNYNISTASDGSEALKMLDEHIPDLIILDLIMPVMDGFEFLEKLRHEKKHPEIPVIVYTTKDLTEAEKNKILQQKLIVINKHETRVEEMPVKIKRAFNRLQIGDLQ